MKATDTNHRHLFEELDYREADGLEISLLWNPMTNGVSVHVFDAKTSTIFEAAVAAEDALQAFHHPFLYAPATNALVALAS